MFLQYEMGDPSLQKTILLPKTKQALGMPFTVTAMGDFTCDEKYYTKRQGDAECLLIYTVEGEGEGIVEYKGKRMTLTSGQVMVLDCREYHYYASNSFQWKFLWMHFSGRCVFDYVGMLNENSSPVFTRGKISIHGYYEKIALYASEFDLKRELEISVLVHELLTLLINLKRTEQFSTKYGRYQKELESSINYMQEYFYENISVAQLAKGCHLSKSYYIKVFKAYTGQTPYDYLLNLRLQHSKLSLIESVKNIEEIAHESGFAESKNFIAAFKLKIGMTPLQFRKQNQVR